MRISHFYGIKIKIFPALAPNLKINSSVKDQKPNFAVRLRKREVIRSLVNFTINGWIVYLLTLRCSCFEK